jgi:hypothetical protein
MQKKKTKQDGNLFDQLLFIEKEESSCYLKGDKDAKKLVSVQET